MKVVFQKVKYKMNIFLYGNYHTGVRWKIWYMHAKTVEQLPRFVCIMTTLSTKIKISVLWWGESTNDYDSSRVVNQSIPLLH